MICNHIKDIRTFEEIFNYIEDGAFPLAYNKPYPERYRDLVGKITNYPVEMGAMSQAIEDFRQHILEISNSGEDNAEAKLKTIAGLAESSSTIFLNDHGIDHIQKVQRRALEIARECVNIDLTFYEIYFLLCASLVHDVGNIWGRSGHEQKIKEVLDKECTDILPDSVERRVISRIARAHGGKVNGNKDTISYLDADVSVNGKHIREQLLAALLRFADELADDASRANHVALGTGILPDASMIYHEYSKALHTVEIEKNRTNNTAKINLEFDIDSKTAERQFVGAGGAQLYLIDEIYNRTIKMEQERRYCTRFMKPYCPIASVSVKITVSCAEDEFKYYAYSYTLEEKGYPTDIYIDELGNTVPTGTQLIEKLRSEGIL